MLPDSYAGKHWGDDTRPRGYSKLTVNEGEACDAIVRRLEERERKEKAYLSWPEKEKHKSPVEVAFKLGDQLYAIEHTVIEPFKGHIRMEAQTEKLFAPIANGLKKSLGTDALVELYLPLHGLDGKKSPELETIHQAIVAWVEMTAPTIPLRSDGKRTPVGPMKVEKVPFDLFLCRFPPIIPGQRLLIKHTVANIEKLRSERMQTAIDKKFPKLAHDLQASDNPCYQGP